MESKIFANIMFCEKADDELNATHVCNKIIVPQGEENVILHSIISIHGYSNELEDSSFPIFLEPSEYESNDNVNGVFINELTISDKGHFKILLRQGLNLSFMKPVLKTGYYELVIYKMKRGMHPSDKGIKIGKSEFELVYTD